MRLKMREDMNVKNSKGIKRVLNQKELEYIEVYDRIMRHQEFEEQLKIYGKEHL